MNRIAQFEIVSLEQYLSDRKAEGFTDEVSSKMIYNFIAKPRRATKHSAGYDFFLPYDIQLEPNQSIKVLTGLRCRMSDNYVLQVYPRSSLGFKYRLQLNNTVGIIDADYYNAENEGHIMIKLCNDSKDGKILELKAGTAFCQGIFIQYGITIDDEASEERIGGFGSTDKRNEAV